MGVDSIRLDSATPVTLPAIEAINDLSFGPDRHRRGVHQLRHGVDPVWDYCLVARKKRGRADTANSDSDSDSDPIIACIQYWAVRFADGTPCLLLGPLAILPDQRGQGIGRQLLTESLARIDNAADGGAYRAIAISGDEMYYKPFGFSPAPQLRVPGGTTRPLIMMVRPLPFVDSTARADGVAYPEGELQRC